MDWITDFRVLPGGCALGSLALATSPLARETEEPIYDRTVRRARGQRPLDLRSLFDLWVLAHYGSATSKEAVKLSLPKILDAQREDGAWQAEQHTGGGELGMINDVFRNPICTTYRVLETLHLSGMLADLAECGALKGDPFSIFRNRQAIGVIVARRDFEQRPKKSDVQLTQDWTEAILADQSSDGSWQGSPTLSAHALHLLADLHADKGREVKRALKWLRAQFRRNTAMPPYDARSRKAKPVLSTFGATTEPLAEEEVWGCITGPTDKLMLQGSSSRGGACWRRIGGMQSALCVCAFNRWGEGTCPEAREWVEQTRLLGQLCGNFASRVFLYIRHHAGEIELTPSEIKSCTHPDIIEAAERLLESRPDLAGGEDIRRV